MMQTIEEIIREAKVIAVVGLSPREDRPSNEVAKYLQEQGYRIVPVNPQVSEVLGEKSYPDLRAIPFPVDVVDVFRRAQDTPPIAEEAVAIGAKALWLQLGIVNEEAGDLARRAGLGVVMDRCMLIEHKRLQAEGKL